MRSSEYYIRLRFLNITVTNLTAKIFIMILKKEEYLLEIKL